MCLVTGTIRDAPAFRITVEATSSTGLLQRSRIMVDKLVTVPRDKCGPRIGSIDREALLALDQSLAFVLGLTDSAD